MRFQVSVPVIDIDRRAAANCVEFDHEFGIVLREHAERLEHISEHNARLSRRYVIDTDHGAAPLDDDDGPLPN